MNSRPRHSRSATGPRAIGSRHSQHSMSSSVNSFRTAEDGTPPPRELPRPTASGSNTEAITARPGPVPLPELPEENNHVEAEEEEGNLFTRSPSVSLLLFFACYLFLLYFVYLSFPELKPEERQQMKIPWTMDEAKAVANILDRYKDNNYWTVFVGFALVYLFLQTFAIPGSIFLSIMSGFLFSFWAATLLVCFCCATGASLCYMLSWLVGHSLVEHYFHDHIHQWSQRVEEERENLLSFIIFLRITPILPNWVINIVAPLIGVPIGVFWIGTFIGVAPPTILAVQAGRTLNMMTSPTEHISWGAIIILCIIGMVSLIPVLLRRR